MIKFEHTEVMGWEHAIRGMRNPLNSWAKSDSEKCDNTDCENCPLNGKECENFVIGDNDLTLMKKLASAGTSHSKYRRMITVYVDITAPLYWWSEYDTYKVGTVANSCSKMHKIHARDLTLEDFSYEHLIGANFEEELKAEDVYIDEDFDDSWCGFDILDQNIRVLNFYRKKFIDTKDKKYWWQMIQLLPTSYNQKRTVMLNYEVLANMYRDRKNHKLTEWLDFCEWVETLPYAEIITGEENENI